MAHPGGRWDGKLGQPRFLAGNSNEMAAGKTVGKSRKLGGGDSKPEAKRGTWRRKQATRFCVRATASRRSALCLPLPAAQQVQPDSHSGAGEGESSGILWRARGQPRLRRVRGPKRKGGASDVRLDNSAAWRGVHDNRESRRGTEMASLGVMEYGRRPQGATLALTLWMTASVSQKNSVGGRGRAAYSLPHAAVSRQVVVIVSHRSPNASPPGTTATSWAT